MHPKAPSTSKGRGKGRGRGRITSLKVAARVKTPLEASSAAPSTPASLSETFGLPDDSNASLNANAVDPSSESGVSRLKGFSRAAHSIISMHKLQKSTENVQQPNDSWASVMSSVARRVSGHSPGDAATSDKRISLAQMLKSREMKNLVQQALVAKQVGRAATVPEEQSRVMSHWIKLSTLRRKQLEPDDDGPATDSGAAGTNNNEEEDDAEAWDELDGVHSGFDLDETSKTHHLYGRTLILEESCRRALAQDGEQRSQMDLQALGVWFQTTKLKITTDFERLQPSELDLLCRRMTCVTFHPDETIFRQGDEGDALYIVFSGTVEVRVSQRILGEVVEVTVCELGKGDYFGERSLLNNDVRAATVLSKSATELVKITRSDYNLMLKNDQLEFLSRMQIANGIGVQRPVQRTQREYVKVLTKKKHARTKADIDMLSEYLQTLKFFRSLPKTFVRELCLVVDFLTLPAGACVFREGEVGDLFYIIFGGSVDVNINSKDFKGNVQMTKLVNLTEGAHFGELALMKGRGVRSATVITREECQLLVICEKDYNSTLRRMQKKDMAKRVGVLDQIPMFQTPEWTGELLKELSYVLLEQKLSTGSVLYSQGDRATHVYFVVRGELVVTKEIADPFTHVKHEVFVERIGRFRVVGDDAAAGANFNEVIHREVTVSASTPVEVLLLSKYDVFHRLSRSARETLRAAAQSHAESIVYLDRFHKTQKWEAYKQKVLREHVNHERIEKILPSAARGASKDSTRGPPAKVLQSRKATAATTISSTSKTSESERVSRPSTGVTLPRLPLPPPSGDQCPDSSRTTISNESAARQALVPANELLLLAQEAKAMKKCLNPDQTLGNYVTSFNVDAPPSAARQRQLDSVLAAEERRQAEVLKEGNPLAFFDIKVVEKQVCTSWNRTTRSLEEVEQGDNDDQAPETSRSSSVSPLRRSSSRSLKITSHALSQLLQENFIFSRPAGRKPQGHEGRKARLQQHKVNPTTTIRKPSTSPSKAHSPSRLQIESVSETDYVAFVILDESSDERSEATFVPKKSPAFQILQTARSLAAAREAAQRFQDSVGVTNLKYFALPLKTYALMPRADRSKVVEERLQLQQVAETNSPRTRTLSSSFIEESTGSLHSTGDGSVHFASFQQVAVAPVPSASNNNEVRPSIPGSVVDSTDQTASTTQSNSLSPRKKTSISSTRSSFAVASVVLSKLEVAQSQFDEPFVAVHALFASELEAVTYAMNLKPAQLLRSSMLCIFPVGKWIYLEHAHDWCVQVETNKREKRAPSLTGAPSTATRSRRFSLVVEPPKPMWEQERDDARRLHNFICARMGVPMPDKKKDRTEDSGGFTPMTLVSLEDKLDTLHNYLQATAAFTARTGHGGVAMLKYRQVKRFGSIMRSRISGTQPHSSNNSNGNSTSPRSSFSHVIPS
ncbi:hypothetical protein PF005_g23763 [Phytophthora fragariae]|uniref:Cyclic nucleotide-binding domain-containing protein n=2 Tax=Phytophthora fragariae TaxID=53985 RepID=A0A6A3QMX8_9STRA|nr:hypothetical protein PF003_g27356 [Phytophthora fragariae]KAE9077214.1 hypothetical protein PF010_g23599 [Phytophthora fragariae]KAE9079014.1 hypothetical protein PF007_g23617 [Phytophthora fragariae]KAE9102895.1 hypothetical protein PF006_g22314 [Phytophthora fragariae]KAE9179228.1 hypothetical protein PF005_g23763 [Phytophthora fragariae]